MNKPLSITLAEARRCAGLTQAAAATKMGVSIACVANLEADGSRRPSFETVARMVECYKMDPRILFSDDWQQIASDDTDLTRAIRGLTADGDMRWQILSSLHLLKIPGSRRQLEDSARQLGVIWRPVD